MHVQQTLNYLCADYLDYLQCGLAAKIYILLISFLYVDIVIQYYLQSELWFFNILCFTVHL